MGEDMKLLVIDAETKDPYIKRKLGSGWAYGYNVESSDFRVLGFALKTYYGLVNYDTDWDSVREHVLEHDAMLGHNITYDLGCLYVLYKDDPDLLAHIRSMTIYDTKLLYKLHNNVLQSYSLDALSEKYLKEPKGHSLLIDAVWKNDLYPWLVREITAKTRAEKKGETYIREMPEESKMLKWAYENMDLVQDADPDRMAAYAISDIDQTERLFNLVRPSLTEELIQDFSKLVHISVEYRLKGMRVDLDKARDIYHKLVPIIAEKTSMACEIAGQEVNINSGKELPPVFDKLGIQYPRTAQGNPSITTPWLENQEHEICKAIIEARKYKKIQGDFIKKIIDMQEFTCPDAEDYGMVYPELNILEAKTGRFSCTHPNCFDELTEILTDNGWKYFKDLTKLDKVAQWEDGIIEFVYPTAYIKKKSEYIYDIQTQQGIDLSITEDHRLLLRTKKGILKDHTVHTYNNCFQQITSGLLKTDKVDVNLHLIFAIQADGSLTKYGVDFSFKVPRKIDMFNNTIKQLKQFKNNRHRTMLRYDEIPQYVWDYVDKDTKLFKPALINLARKDILEYLMFWDGDWTRKSEWKNKHKSDCDIVQALVTCSGYRAYLGTHTVSGKTYNCVRINHKDYYWTTNRTITKRKYNKDVYCVSVPSSYIVTRRNKSVAVTGQCQQIPSRDPILGPMCRSIFVPFEGETMYALDFSNQEGRLQVHYASLLGCEGANELVCQFNNDPAFDVHQQVADLVGITRKEAKTINLGISYGMGIKKLARSLGISDAQARLLRGKYDDLAPYLTQLNRKCIDVMKKRGYIKTIGGRKSYQDPAIYKDGERITFEYKALNKLIQGSAADQIIRAMIQAYDEGIPVIMPIHDELLISGTRDHAERLKEIMESCIELRIPSLTEIGEGDNWSECK